MSVSAPERARVLLEEADQTLDQIARDTGFGSSERMRRTFARHLRVVPDQYRRHFESAGEVRKSKPASAPVPSRRRSTGRRG